MKINKLTGRWVENEAAMKPPRKARSRKRSRAEVKGPRPKTYVAMLMDKSSSMNNCRDQARNHFNEQVAAIRDESDGQDIRATLVMFAGNLNYVYFNAPLDSLTLLTREDYYPGGMTALNDAIGCTIDKMKSEIDDINEDHVSILFVIVTDGMENVSRIYPQKHILAARMKALQDEGRWTFTYLGTGHNVEVAASAYAIPKGNTKSFEKKNFMRATEASNDATSNYLQSRRRGVKSADQFYDKKI